MGIARTRQQAVTSLSRRTMDWAEAAESRRAFLKQGALLLAGTATLGSISRTSMACSDSEADVALRFGLLTDCHYADKPSSGKRYYQDSLGKMREAVSRFTSAKAEFVVELGDLIDSGSNVKEEIAYLQTMEKEFAKFKKDRHFVLGNHCVYNLTKEEFFDNCAAKKPHYAFDQGGFHFVVLDACFREDGVAYGRQNYDWTDSNIPASQIEWLADDLKETDKPTIAFIHQRIDKDDVYAVKNAPEVRETLERSGNVLGVFQGHTHQNDYNNIRGIHYCTLRAVVEDPDLKNNSFALVDLFADGSIRVDGFHRQKDYTWQPQEQTT